MELREIRKEVHSLQDVEENISNFQEHWIRPLRSNTNNHLPFLKKIPKKLKKDLNKKLSAFSETLSEVKKGSFLHGKLRTYAKYLVQMKLNTLRGNYGNSKLITNWLLNDDALSMKRTIQEVKSFDKNVQKMSEQYHEINELLHKSLSLEEVIFLMELPHKRYLYHLQETSKKQKKIVRNIGRHFVSLAKKGKLGSKK